MKKGIMITLIVAGALVLLGAGLFAGAMTAGGWDFAALQTQRYQPVTYEAATDFSNISVQTGDSCITFLPSEDGTCQVECMESEFVTYDVSVQDGTLRITTNDMRKWYHHVGIFNTQRLNMTVYLPKAAYDALQVESQTGSVSAPSALSFANVRISLDTGALKWDAGVTHGMNVETDTGLVQIGNVHADGAISAVTDTGHVKLFGVQAQSIQVKTRTGKVSVTDATVKDALCVKLNTGNAKLSGCRATDIVVETTTGKAMMADVVAAGKMDIQTDTGDVELDRCDAAEIKIETDTGDVEGSLLSDKIFIYKTDTGRVELPKTTTGGVCDITTDTGDIKIKIP